MKAFVLFIALLHTFILWDIFEGYKKNSWGLFIALLYGCYVNLFELIRDKNAIKSKMDVRTERVWEIKVEYMENSFLSFTFFYRKVYNAIVRVNYHRIGNLHDAYVVSSISNILKCL